MADFNLEENSEAECPGGWEKAVSDGIPYCKLAGSEPCLSSVYPTNPISYSQVCGRVKSYQIGRTTAFFPYTIDQDFDVAYVDGVSITRGTLGSIFGALPQDISPALETMDSTAPASTITKSSYHHLWGMTTFVTPEPPKTPVLILSIVTILFGMVQGARLGMDAVQGDLTFLLTSENLPVILWRLDFASRSKVILTDSKSMSV